MKFNKKLLAIFIILVIGISIYILSDSGKSLAMADIPTAPYLMQSDTTLAYKTDKTEILSYLDNLQKRGINVIWVQVELYVPGTVTYKKTTLSNLPLDPKFDIPEWADDDFLDFVIREGRKRGIGSVIKLHGSNHPAWDANPDWRKLDHEGNESLWQGTLKNFCVNSPYWDEMFFPMVKELAINYPDLVGIYWDTCQIIPVTVNVCFCQNCKERFERETGSKLPIKPITEENLSDPLVRLHNLKRVEWCNAFYERFYNTIRDIRPEFWVVTNMGGSYHSYRDGFFPRHAGQYVTHITPEPVSTPRMFSAVHGLRRRAAGITDVNENAIAREMLNLGMNTYAYNEFNVKTLRAESGDAKPVIPISRFWFIDERKGWMGSEEVEIGTIESGLAGGAKGFCFFGYLGDRAFVTNAYTTTLWADPEYIAYLNSIRTGRRAKLIANSKSANEIGLIYDRDYDFWSGNYWSNFTIVGGVYGLLHNQNKMPVDLIATSEPDIPYFGKSGYKINPDILDRYRVILVPRWKCVQEQDVLKLYEYVKRGGNVIFFGHMGKYDGLMNPVDYSAIAKYFNLEFSALYSTAGKLVSKETEHPIFYGLNTKESKAYQGSAPVQSWAVKSEGYTVLAKEQLEGKTRDAILYKKLGKGHVLYFNFNDMGNINPEFREIVVNAVNWLTDNQMPVIAENLPETAILNLFTLPDYNIRYAHIFNIDPASDVGLKFRIDAGEQLSEVRVITEDKPEGEIIPFEIKENYIHIFIEEMKPFYSMIELRFN